MKTHIDDDILADAARFDAQRQASDKITATDAVRPLKPALERPGPYSLSRDPVSGVERIACGQSGILCNGEELSERAICNRLNGALADAEALNDEIARLRDSLVIAFVQGASRWEYVKTGSTLWGEDRRTMEIIALEMLADGTLGRLAQPISAEPATPPTAPSP